MYASVDEGVFWNRIKLMKYDERADDDNIFN